VSAEVDELTLSAEWAAWVTENALNGASAQELIQGLVEEGLTPELAEREVVGLITSAPFQAAQQWRREALRLRQSNNLRAALYWGHAPTEIERRAGLSLEELRWRYLSASQPVILTDVVNDWPALERWSDEGLKERIGHLTVTCCRGRASDPRPSYDIKRFFHDIQMNELIDLIANTERSNDVYLVGNNQLLQREGAKVLLHDLDEKINAYLEGGVKAERASFWFGPAGTLTELHHDPVSVLYAQVRGYKRFRLVSPLNREVLLKAQGTYSQVDLELVSREMNGHHYELTLAPGELLLLPAGWWHEVYALTQSVSLGMTNLKGANAFGWYKPGSI
jgi:hypothetical protein